MSEPRFIPVQINLTQKQIKYLVKIRQLDGIARGPYIKSLLKRDMERGVILNEFESRTERTVTRSTVKRKVVARQQVEQQRVELLQELKQVLDARRAKLATPLLKS